MRPAERPTGAPHVSGIEGVPGMAAEAAAVSQLQMTAQPLHRVDGAGLLRGAARGQPETICRPEGVASMHGCIAHHSGARGCSVC